MYQVLFHFIQCYIMHKAIEPISHELDMAKEYTKSIVHQIFFREEDTLILKPDGKSCILNYEMPI